MKHLGLLAAFAALLFTSMSCCKEGFFGKGEQDLSLLYGEWQEYTSLYWDCAHTYSFSSDGTYHYHCIDTVYPYEKDSDGTYQIVKSKDGNTILIRPGNDTMAYLITYLSTDEMEWELWGTDNPEKRHFFKVKK